MNVQDDAGPADPTITAVVPRVTEDPPRSTARAAGTDQRRSGPPSAQGQLFADAYPTYADTDQLPAVSPSRSRSPHRTHRWLRVAVVLVAVAVLGAAAALALVKSGVLKTGSGSGSGTSGSSTSGPHATHPDSTTPVATQTSVGNGTATYTVGFPIYAVTVSTTSGRSWVSIGAIGQPPRFEGILEPAGSQKVVLLGPSTVAIGAGGTKVTIAVGHRTTILTPPSAPFTYQFEVPKRS